VAPTTIEAVLFDFGQTPVDSADGFRAAEKEAQARLMADLAIARQDEFLEDYRLGGDFGAGNHPSPKGRNVGWSQLTLS
jgi:hypothetical protein